MKNLLSIIVLLSVSFLIEAGADVSDKDTNGQTPLHNIYNMYSKRELAEMVADAGFNFLAKNENGQTLSDLLPPKDKIQVQKLAEKTSKATCRTAFAR